MEIFWFVLGIWIIAELFCAYKGKDEVDHQYYMPIFTILGAAGLIVGPVILLIIWLFATFL